MKKTPLHPGKLMGISGSYWMSCTLHAGVKLDIFTVIGDNQLTAESVARQIGADPRALEMLLNALAALELLKKKDAFYENSDIAREFLSQNARRYIGHIIMHHHHLVESWSALDQAVTSGKPVRTRASFDDETVRKSFLMGMFNMAMNLAPRIVPLIDLSGRKHLLDLGGGPGTYAIHFCQANPGLAATVYDLPTTRPFAEETIKKFNLSDRITFVDGDYVSQEIQGAFDAAWLSHVLHGEGPDTCRKMIAKTARVLEPGGIIILHDFILNNRMDGPVFPALFSLNMLIGTRNGQAYAERQIMDMLEDNGLTQIRRISFESPNDSGLIVGTKP